MSRLNLRRKPRISYYEIEEPNLDEYIYCDECTDFVYEYCAIHGPLLVVPDDKVLSRAGIPPWVPRAALTVPKVFLHIAPSIIPGASAIIMSALSQIQNLAEIKMTLDVTGAGLGIFSTLTLPRGVRFGPYQGKRSDQVTSMYCWQIKSPEQKQLTVVDALDGETSNWMRYVNCARSWREQNLVAFQYQGQIYYRTVKIIPKFTELLVFYGSEFANALGIDLRHYNAPPASQYGAPPAKIPKLTQNKTIEEKHASVTSKKGNEKQAVVTDPGTTLSTKGVKKPKVTKSKQEKTRQRSKPTAKGHNKDTKANNTVLDAKGVSTRKLNTQELNEITSTAKIAKVDEDQNTVIKILENENITSLDHNIVQNTIKNKENFNCSDSGETFNNKSLLNGRKVDVYLYCKSCEYRCVTKDSLERHIRLHDSKRPYQCDICLYRFTGVSILKIHLQKHTDVKSYQCNICQYKCNKKGHLKTHLRTHTGEKPYACNICQYKCNRKDTLKTHLRTHTGEKPYACNICQYKCNIKGHLKRHLRTHTGEKPYACNICQYKCNIKGHLKTHLRTHTGEKPYACNICQYKCNQKGALKSHLRTHTGEKPYACNICQYKCNQKHSLKRHLRTHTGEKPFKEPY